MKKLCQFALPALSALVMSTPATLFAQEAKPNPFNGEWAVSFSTPNNAYTYHAKLVVQDAQGHWDVSNPNKMSHCHGPEYPISVVKAEPKVLVAVIQSASIRPDCEDTKIILKVNEDLTVTGTYGKNPSLTATRR